MYVVIHTNTIVPFGVLLFFVIYCDAFRAKIGNIILHSLSTRYIGKFIFLYSMIKGYQIIRLLLSWNFFILRDSDFFYLMTRLLHKKRYFLILIWIDNIINVWDIINTCKRLYKIILIIQRFLRKLPISVSVISISPLTYKYGQRKWLKFDT